MLKTPVFISYITIYNAQNQNNAMSVFYCAALISNLKYNYKEKKS